jgi:hypothetical protein
LERSWFNDYRRRVSGDHNRPNSDNEPFKTEHRVFVQDF